MSIILKQFVEKLKKSMKVRIGNLIREKTRKIHFVTEQLMNTVETLLLKQY